MSSAIAVLFLLSQAPLEDSVKKLQNATEQLETANKRLETVNIERPEVLETPCAATHPAQFTYVIVKNESDVIDAFKPARQEDSRCFDDVMTMGDGRFSISERGEIIIRFDASKLKGANGALMVTGKVVSDQSTRDFEVPGYRVLGKQETPQVVLTDEQKKRMKAAIDVAAEQCKPEADGGCLFTAKGTDVDALAVLNPAETSPLSSFSTFANKQPVVAADLKTRVSAAKLAIDAYPANWSDVRVQPKEIGAREGEVIELRVRHANGQSVEPTWTLRFVVEKTGVYVHASPVLGLVWTIGYAEGESLRGAQGQLVPGVEFTLDWYAGRYGPAPLRVLGFIFSGVGIALNYLDFDSRQPVELGLQGNIQLFRGILSFGVGYNFGPQAEPRWTDRSVYLSVGVGVDKVLDRAAKVAAFFAQ